jgi:hypothetical protein
MNDWSETHQIILIIKVSKNIDMLWFKQPWAKKRNGASSYKQAQIMIYAATNNFFLVVVGLFQHCSHEDFLYSYPSLLSTAIQLQRRSTPSGVRDLC